MSRIHVDDIYDKEGTGAPSLPAGVVVTGVTTSTSFSGSLTGNVTGNVTGDLTGDATGLSGTPDITVGTVNATSVTATTFVGVPAGFTELDAALFN